MTGSTTPRILVAGFLLAYFLSIVGSVGALALGDRWTHLLLDRVIGERPVHTVLKLVEPLVVWPGIRRAAGWLCPVEAEASRRSDEPTARASGTPAPCFSGTESNKPARGPLRSRSEAKW